MRSKWRDAQLGDVCEITSSKRIFAKEYRSVGIPFYRGKEIIEKQKGSPVSTELYIEPARYDELSKKHGAPQPGDILLTSVGTLGVPYVVQKNEKFYFKDGNLTWFRNFIDADSLYIYYWLLSPWGRTQIDTKCIGSTQKALTIETLLRFDILLPPFPEQHAIAATLSCLDDKIELNNKINANLEAQAQAIFKSWFVDFEPFQDGEFVDSELGLIPKGWRVGALSEIADITMGQSPSGKSYNEDSEGIVFYQGRAEFGWRFPTIRLYTTEPKRMAKENDILMSIRAPVGDINIATEDCCIGRGLAAVHSKAGMQSYILYLLMNLQPQFDAYNGEGTVFGSINQKAFNTMKTIIPSEEAIKDYEAVCNVFDTQIRALCDQNRTLATLRDTLLPKLMSGEIEVH